MSFYSNVFYNALNSSAVLVIASGYSIYCKLETGRVQSGCSLVQFACATHTPDPRRIAPALQFTFSSCSPDCELGQTSAVCSSFRCGQGALRLQVNAPRVKSRVVEVLRDSAGAMRWRRQPWPRWCGAAHVRPRHGLRQRLRLHRAHRVERQ